MKSLLSEAWRLNAFVPPFTFSAFFSPEDTLLCVCAAESAQSLVPSSTRGGIRIAELTSGSGLVGFYLLGPGGGRSAGGSTLLGLDVDPEAAVIAGQNARLLGFANRARFAVSDLWSPQTLALLQNEQPQLLVCNPPYVPEPPGTTMQLEAGAGSHGTAHLLRTLDLTRELRPDSLALSWCSLSDPVGIAAAADQAGYEMVDLFVTAIADGEYSGSVHNYLRDLDDCYINEDSDTLKVIASDGAARFSYLLFAASFRRREASDSASRSSVRAPISLLPQLCKDFAVHGISALSSRSGDGVPGLHRYLLDRWDELQLRVMLHGVPARPALSTP